MQQNGYTLGFDNPPKDEFILVWAISKINGRRYPLVLEWVEEGGAKGWRPTPNDPFKVESWMQVPERFDFISAYGIPA